MEKPKRKPNRLYNYDYSRNGMYFITICTKNKEHIFCDIVGDGVLDVPLINNVNIRLSQIGIIVKKHILRINQIGNMTVDKYVIMPNHIHLIVCIDKPSCYEDIQPRADGTSGTLSPTNAAIPRTIAEFKRLINKEAGRNIFQRSYHDHIIRNEKDYEKIWEYIETNPIKWKTDCFYTD